MNNGIKYLPVFSEANVENPFRNLLRRQYTFLCGTRHTREIALGRWTSTSDLTFEGLIDDGILYRCDSFVGKFSTYS